MTLGLACRQRRHSQSCRPKLRFRDMLLGMARDRVAVSAKVRSVIRAQPGGGVKVCPDTRREAQRCVRGRGPISCGKSPAVVAALLGCLAASAFAEAPAAAQEASQGIAGNPGLRRDHDSGAEQALVSLSRGLRRQWGSRGTDQSGDRPHLQRLSLRDWRDRRQLAAWCSGTTWHCLVLRDYLARLPSEPGTRPGCSP
jgi:hypothetical protein